MSDALDEAVFIGGMVLVLVSTSVLYGQLMAFAYGTHGIPGLAVVGLFTGFALVIIAVDAEEVESGCDCRESTVKEEPPL